LYVVISHVLHESFEFVMFLVMLGVCQGAFDYINGFRLRSILLMEEVDWIRLSGIREFICGGLRLRFIPKV